MRLARIVLRYGELDCVVLCSALESIRGGDIGAEDIDSVAEEVVISPQCMQLRVVVYTVRGVGSSRLNIIVCAVRISDRALTGFDDIGISESLRTIIALDYLSTS